MLFSSFSTLMLPDVSISAMMNKLMQLHCKETRTLNEFQFPKKCAKNQI